MDRDWDTTQGFKVVKVYSGPHNKPRRFNGKCKRCGRGYSVIALTAEVVGPAGYGRPIPFDNPRVDQEYLRMSREGGYGGEDMEYVDEKGRIMLSRRSNPYEIYLKCLDCGHGVALKSVVGVYNPSKVCNAKCMAATGPSCECSCGGANHGAGHSF